MTAIAGRAAPSGFTLPPIATMLLVFTVATTGAAGLVMEYVIATVSTYILGSSIEQWSIIIGTMMAAMGVGAFWQKRLKDDYLVEKFLAIEIALVLLGGFAPLIIYAGYAYLETYFSVILFATAGGIGFMIGCEIPLIMRINARYVGELKENLGWVFAFDFIGAFVGSIIWVKFLLANFPLTEISFLVSGVNFFVASVTVAYFWRTGMLRFPRTAFAAILVTFAAIGYGWHINRDWSMTIEQRLYDSPIAHAETSKYQRIVLTHDVPLNDWRLYLNGGLQFSSSDEAIYHEHLVHPVMAIAPSRERVLILGGGDGLALREVLKYRDVREVTLVDIDPAIIALASTHPTLRSLNADSFADARVHARASTAVQDDGFRTVSMEAEEARPGVPALRQDIATVNVYNVDALRFLADAGEGAWDVVIIDFPDPDQVELAKLYSREFYRALSNSLSPEGVVAIQATSPFHAKEAFLCVGRTMQAGGLAVVPYHANVPSFGDWGWYIASASRDAPALRASLEGIQSFPVPVRHLTPDLVDASLAFGQGSLTARFTGINSVMEPVLLQYYVHEAWKVE